MSNNKLFVESLETNSADYFNETLIKLTGFREYDVRWLIEDEINYNGFLLLGKAYGTYLQDEYGLGKIVVGHDFRQYSQNVKNAFVLGLISTGMKVIDIGLCVSPCLYFAQHHLDIKGGAMITASHNENGWTGIKLGYDKSKTLGPDGIIALKKLVKSGKFRNGPGEYTENNTIQEVYIADCASMSKVDKPLRIVVATGNGTGGAFTPEILRRAGHTVIEQHVKLDWNFPNFNPNPEDVEFLHDIGKAVRENNADFGIGIDGDGDRLGVVDEFGEEIFSDKIGLLIARDMAKDCPDSTFVIDVKSTGLYMVDDVIKKNNCKIELWKTGHSYIKSKVHETNALAGFEKSGHFFLNKPYGRVYDDGSLSAVIFANLISKNESSVSTLLKSLTKSYNTPTMSPYCDDTKKYDVVEKIKELFNSDFKNNVKKGGAKITELITVNGIRVQFDDKSWGLVRASSNKPSLVVVAESFTSRKRVYDIIDDINEKLKEVGDVGEWDQTLPDYPGED